MPRRLMPYVCGAFVAAVTRAYPRFPLLFQDGNEGVDGSSPSEGFSGKAKPLQKAAFLLPIKTLWTTSLLRRGSIVVDDGASPPKLAP
jgi:hypothetical protein